jgi:uncharacterized protein YgiM (DUF1202 family)
MCRNLAAALAMLVCIAVPTAGSASAAPASSESNAPVAEVNLGGGSYRVTASVFAEGTDGQVGSTASSGHVIQPNDNLVALPGCTESSCPWVPVGTGTEGTYGPQTACAEDDGLCWVEIVSDETGECTVAPVHDRGPLFIRDNWWAPQSQREYSLPQGEPAAEYAVDGGNLGFGSGISDAGFDIRNVYTYAAGIDLAGGTWTALGLPTSAGITTVTVTMLWQTGITHDEACGNSPAPNPTQPPTGGGNATVIDGALNLRSGPSYSAGIVTVMPGDSRVTVTGGSQNGFYPITFGSTSGWALGDYLDIDAGEDPGPDDGGNPSPSETATVIGGELNLRASASTSATVLLVMPDGATVTLNGQSSNGFLSVTYQGRSGWAYAIYLSTGDDIPSGDTATVIDGALNLRASASTSAAVVTVMPDGAVVTLLGQSSNGFSKVSYNGSTGWAYSIYLDSGGGSGSGEVATVFDGELNLRSGAGTGYAVLLVLPDGAEVTLTGTTSNGFSQVIYQGTTGWASSQWLIAGDSSGLTATVIDGALNLRGSASLDGSVLTVMPDGATVTLLGESANGFSRATYQGTTGWAYSLYLQ